MGNDAAAHPQEVHRHPSTMAHQHILLVKDEAFNLPSLRDHQAQRQNGPSSNSSRLLAKVASYTHPRSGQATKFMLLGDDLLELQAARPREPQELSSFFIDQSVQQDGSVLMASRIDPLFLLLPILSKHATKWCPLDQALAEAGCGGLRGLRHLDASKLCDVNDRLGPEELLIRINEDMVIKWLTAKVKRATERFAELAKEGGGAHGEKGFARGFQATAERGTDRSEEVQAECQQQALEAVCEYLGDDWAGKLTINFGTERARLFGGGKASAPKKRKGVWEESEDADRNLELSHGGAGDSKTKSEVAAAPKAKKQVSQAQKNLSKVNKKGMKSITSFFNK